MSDAHRLVRAFEYIEKEHPNELKVCLGDSQMSPEYYEEYAKNTIFLLGNGDYNYHQEPREYGGVTILFRSSEDLAVKEIVFEIEGVTFVACHGHLLPMEDFDYLTVWEADVLLSGHTHRYKELERNGMYSINPGSCNPYQVRDLRPDWYPYPPSYCIVTVDDGKVIDIEKVEMDIDELLG